MHITPKWLLRSDICGKLQFSTIPFLSHRRANVPNIDSKILSYLVWVHAQLFSIWGKIFLYMHNRWILLFQIVHKRSFFFNVFMEKLAVYDDELHLSLLGALSLISTLIQNSSKIQSFQKNKFFTSFGEKTSKGHESSFVEHVKIYQNLKVHEKRIYL